MPWEGVRAALYDSTPKARRWAPSSWRCAGRTPQANPFRPGGSERMSTKFLIREDRGPVAVLTLNRPDRRNALSHELLAQLRDVLDELGIDTSIRVVVLTGAGAAFCS